MAQHHTNFLTRNEQLSIGNLHRTYYSTKYSYKSFTCYKNIITHIYHTKGTTRLPLSISTVKMPSKDGLLPIQ